MYYLKFMTFPVFRNADSIGTAVSFRQEDRKVVKNNIVIKR